MPETVPHRELRNDSSRILRAVQSGETYVITNHGEAVAVLSPMSAESRPPLRMRPARTQGGFSGLPRVRPDRPTGEVLDELRGDR